MLVKLLIPHACAAVSFAAAYGWMRHVGTNRSLPDLYLGVAGYVFGLAAIAASAVAVAIVLAKRDQRHRWGWLMAHLAMLVLIAMQGSSWIAMHLA